MGSGAVSESNNPSTEIYYKIVICDSNNTISDYSYSTF